MKKILSFLLATVMCLSMFGTVFAAEFNFTDVKTSDWFYNDVKSAVEMGLVNGKTPTTYAPNDNLTYAEAIKLAACMHQLYVDGEITLKSGSPWYKPYVDYCIDNEIIDKEYNYTDVATRAGYMGIFAKALPDEGLEAINNVPDDSIPDVPSSRAYAAGVYKLYRAGILTGVDEAHNCNPLANIKRSEVAAILTRMMNEDKRVSITDMGEETKPEEKDPEEVTNPEETKPEEKEPAEVTKPEEKEPEEVTDPETTEPENSENNESSGGAKDKFQPAETVEDTEDKGFLMYAEDVFYVTGKGVVATGRIIKGELKKGDAIKIISADGSETEATVAGIEMFNKNLDEAKKGDNIGLLLSSEIEKSAVARGDALIGADAGYDVANTLVGTLTLLAKEEGGRTTAIEEEFSPQFYYANDVTGVITGLTDGTMNPGETQENITVKFTSHKGVWYVGQTLEVRQAGRKFGTFTVTKIGSSSSRPTGSRPSTTTRPITKVALEITTQPTSKSATLSATELFTVEATGGSAPYTYQWYAVTTVAGKTTNVAMSDTGVTISGAKTATLSLRPTAAGTTTIYCVVTDANGDTVKSNNVTFTVTASTSGGRGSLPSGKADGGY